MAAEPWPARRWIAEGLLTVVGAALVLGALLASPAWFDRHFLRAFFIPRGVFVAGEIGVRIAAAALGLVLALVLRPRLGRLVARSSPRVLAADVLRAALALTLAVVVSELALRALFSRAAEEAPSSHEPLRRPDPRLGWVFAPARVGHVSVAGRPVDYAFDAHGYRVASLAQPVDPAQPSIVFAGESTVTGFGLRWAESIPAQVGAALHLQSANLSVFGYADDQTYLRLATELPRFSHPAAVVILWSPGLFFRDFDDDRPHLGPGMVWRPAVQRWRFETLSRLFAAYHSDAEMDRTTALVRAELQADVALARAHGACALIVTPAFGPEDAAERSLRQQVLDQPRLPYVRVDLDRRWRIAGDLHPDAHGARVIAEAVTDALHRCQ